MKIKCDFCDNTYEDTLEQCPFCGSPNPVQKGVLDNTPKTIEELKKWYDDRKLPPEYITRFFIGVNFKEPKAFGIYQDGDEFVVYKNKANGSRAVRYRGKDEAYAVNELYQKLKEEIVNQKSGNVRNLSEKEKRRPLNIFLSLLIGGSILWACAFFTLFAVVALKDAQLSRYNGYYDYHDTTYYSYDSNWYRYDSSGPALSSYEPAWESVDASDPVIQEIKDNKSDYYICKDWDSSLSATDWKDSSFYSDNNSPDYSSGSSFDSGYDWSSSDSWSSSGTDWDSDW